MRLADSGFSKDDIIIVSSNKKPIASEPIKPNTDIYKIKGSWVTIDFHQSNKYLYTVPMICWSSLIQIQYSNNGFAVHVETKVKYKNLNSKMQKSNWMVVLEIADTPSIKWLPHTKLIVWSIFQFGQRSTFYPVSLVRPSASATLL